MTKSQPGKPTLKLLFVLALAAGLLLIGLGKDYRLKHEDNNALFTTFARSHLELGLGRTQAHDTFVNRADQSTSFYAHHPPGPGLALALAATLTGSDAPLVVRSVAISAQLLSLLLLYRLVRQHSDEPRALLTVLVFAILPMGAFYGRMINHEVLALPAMILFVDSYLRLTETSSRVDLGLLVVSAILGAMMGWVFFFSVAACGAHALLCGGPQPSTRLLRFFGLTVLGTALFVLNVGHIAWVLGGDLEDLKSIFFLRAGAGQDYGVLEWTTKMLDFARRLFSATAVISMVWLFFEIARGLRQQGIESISRIDAAFFIFVLTGGGYLAVFNWGAWQHHYWQYPFLPAAAIAVSKTVPELLHWARTRRGWRLVVVGMILTEVLATSCITLYKRHTRIEPFVVETVERLRNDHL